MLRNNDIIKPHVFIIDGKACGFDLSHNNGVGIPSLAGDIDLKDIPGTRNNGQLPPCFVVIVSRCPRTVPGVCCYIIPKINDPDKCTASVLRYGESAFLPYQVDVCL